jgi:arylsulfatase A-like enzyme
MSRTIPRLITIAALALACGMVACNGQKASDAQLPDVNKPNVVIFYIDDLGYGDVGSYGATDVDTPNIDLLAAGGMRFTDAHSSAATCTPSRYSLLTGEHGFRVDADILEGDAGAMIQPGKPTLPAMLKKAGYTTAVVGKWHLGLGDGDADWNGEIKPGPLDIGFDSSFLLPATGDRVPTVYIDGRRVMNLDSGDPIEISYSQKVGNRPTGYENPDLLRVAADPQHSDTIINGVSRIGHMAGGESALWVDEEFPDIFTARALQFIQENKDGPFFLFHSFHDIHVPRLPNPRFAGATTMGARGDAIVQTDWMVGQVMDELEKLGIAENTLVIFTSDNGPVLDDGYADKAVDLIGDHAPSGPFRGGKYSAYEAGTRIPLINYWPGTIEPGVSDALLSQLDLYATLAELVGQELKPGEALDSRMELDAWLGHPTEGREFLIEESVGTLSLRHENWKYIPATVRNPSLDWVADDKGIEGGFKREAQLYNLDTDPGERTNVAAQFPEIVTAMDTELKRIVMVSYR